MNSNTLGNSSHGNKGKGGNRRLKIVLMLVAVVVALLIALSFYGWGNADRYTGYINIKRAALCGNGVVDSGEKCDIKGNVGCGKYETCVACSYCKRKFPKLDTLIDFFRSKR